MTTSNSNRQSHRLHVVVIVLGDVGRSPRMQYHTLSLLQEGHAVSLIGYQGEALIPELEESLLCNDNTNKQLLQVIRFQVPSLPRILERSMILYFCWRILALTFCLARALAQVVTPPPPPPPPTTTTPTTTTTTATPPAGGSDKSKTKTLVHAVLVQNPPALPLLWVAHWYCIWQGWRQKQPSSIDATDAPPVVRPALIIDWHNLGFSMLNKTGLLTRILHRYEQWMAPKAQGHLCVTHVMKEFLLQDMLRSKTRKNHNHTNINLQVLYDCPPPFFRPLSSPDEEHELMTRLHSKLCLACPKSWYDSLADFQTLFTERRSPPPPTSSSSSSSSPDLSSSSSLSSMHQSRRGRPALIMSSTSWTPDEDFNILLDALLLLEERITMQQSALKVVVVVTGKGPLRSMYQQRIAKLQLRHVAITTLWLEMKDYPTLIACADLTISLHTSTSGLDLPMKLLDSFGCHVPALAYKYEALLVEPLLKHDVHGCLFQHHLELAEQLFWLLQPLAKAPYIQQSTPPHGFGELQRYSHAIAKRQGDGKHGWHENWKAHAWPVLQRAVFPTVEQHVEVEEEEQEDIPDSSNLNDEHRDNVDDTTTTTADETKKTK